ncbi:hypothetical protein L0222_22405 [bacterium]|nr:hypothetical protein [bacterium]MCI0605511.1 hypothetical protein [bacterium]
MMKNHKINDSPPGSFTNSLAAASILYVIIAGAVQWSEAQPATDPRKAMITTLAASGPHSSIGDEARLFDRFVGAWDCDFTFYNDDGTTRHSSGEILFGWVLDGRVLQDIWITYPKDRTKERSIGTSVRFFDPKSKMWRVIFVNPNYGSITMQGGAEGDSIVLRGEDDEGSTLRWSFNDIKADSFVWRGETSRDSGKTWRLEEKHLMRRRAYSVSESDGPPDAKPAGMATELAKKSKSAVAFEQLSSLVGEWKGVQDGIEITLTYTLTADGSALMEEFRPAKGPVMITMFSVEGNHLIATHYCSAGNQPQMITKAIQEPQGKPLVFSLLRVTGMRSPEDWHNTGLEVLLEDKDHLTQKWTYIYKGKMGTNIFRFTRKLG